MYKFFFFVQTVYRFGINSEKGCWRSNITNEFKSFRWRLLTYFFPYHLLSDHNTSKAHPKDIFSSISNNVDNNAWKDKQLYLSVYMHKKNLSGSSKTSNYPIMGNNNTKMSYRDLYQNKCASYPESNDSKYQLSADHILQQLSVRFTLTLCNAIVDSMSKKCEYFDDRVYRKRPVNFSCYRHYLMYSETVTATADFEEFVRLLHEIVFSPSVLKSDDRTPEEVLSAVLNTLQRSQTPRRKFIQISYQVCTCFEFCV